MGDSHEQMAAVLEGPVSTAEIRLHDARVHLRRRMEAQVEYYLAGLRPPRGQRLRRRLQCALLLHSRPARSGPTQVQAVSRQGGASEAALRAGLYNSLDWFPDGLRIRHSAGQADTTFTGRHHVLDLAMRLRAVGPRCCVRGSRVPPDSRRIAFFSNTAHDWNPCWAPDGARIGFVSDRDGNYEIYSMNTGGDGQVRLTNNAAADSDPAWSPDGTRLAFTSDRDGNLEIYVMDASGEGQLRLTSNTSTDAGPSWSPDGTKIAFWSERDGVGDSGREIYVMDADGSRQTRLTSNSADDDRPAWSPDGTQIVFYTERDGDGGQELYAVMADGSSPTRLTTSAGANTEPAWSPDGSRIVFRSSRDAGNDEIYVMSAAGGGQTRLTSVPANDDQPSWSPFMTITNHVPLATGQSVSTSEDTPVQITLAGSDPDADPLTYAVASGPSYGALSGTAPALIYTPSANYNGSDSFSFTISDGQLTSAPATVSITVATVNDAPLLSEPDSLTLNEDAGPQE
ncbi:MAG: Ig-like domain-containing protein, partial [Candidatus Latescibacterota bacterium]